MVSTTAGGRPLKSAASRPGGTHGGSIDLDAGAIWCRAPERGCPSSEECAVAKEMSSGNQVRVGQWGATSRTCSSSSLRLHSVCASRLTGGNAYLLKARGQLCASASVPRGPSVRENYSWQWEDAGGAALLREAQCAGLNIDSAWGGAALEDAGGRPRRRAD